MTMIKNFIISLFVPKAMWLRRDTTILLAIVIFLAEAVLLALPLSNYFTTHQADYLEDYSLYNLVNITDADSEELNTIYQDIIDNEYVVSSKALTSNVIEDTSAINEYSITYTSLGITRTVYIIFDLGNTIPTTTPSLSTFTYNVTNYLPDETHEYSFLIFQSDAVEYYSEPYGVDDLSITHNGNSLIFTNYYCYYSYKGATDFKLNQVDASHMFGDICSLLTLGMSNFYSSIYQIYLVLYNVVFTALMALIFMIIFRKRNKLKGFKEYYNILAISSIAPEIITFIVLWFWPGFMNYYIALVALYYLFVLYVFAKTPEDLLGLPFPKNSIPTNTK